MKKTTAALLDKAERAIKAADRLLKDFHLSMAGRFVKLIPAARAPGVALITGGPAHDEGFVI